MLAALAALAVAPFFSLPPFAITTLARILLFALLVEQDLHLALGVADEVAIMARGSIVHRSDTAAFRSDPGTAHRLLGVEE